MAWYCQATGHYLSQCWSRSMSPYMASLGHNELSLSAVQRQFCGQMRPTNGMGDPWVHVDKSVLRLPVMNFQKIAASCNNPIALKFDGCLATNFRLRIQRDWKLWISISYGFPTCQVDWKISVTQCLRLSKKRCRSSCHESQIVNIKLKKNQQKVPGPPPKLSAFDRRTCGDFQMQNWWHTLQTVFGFQSLCWMMFTIFENEGSDWL